MRVNHNISAKITQGALFAAHRKLGKSLEKLSTGLRINSAADDAAGLGVSENLRTQVRGLKQAMKNTQDAIALLNIADGALNEQAEILQRMRELIIQARNDTYTQKERSYMGREFSALRDELDRIAEAANYNGMQLFAAPENYYGHDGNPNHRIYENDQALRNDTPHMMYDARLVVGTLLGTWGDIDRSVFGADDVSSSHHFNMMIGANYTDQDIAAFHSTPQAWDNSEAVNMITIQIGQMDSNGLLSIGPSNATFGDASEVFDDFDFDPGTVAQLFGGTSPDTQDFYIALGYDSRPFGVLLGIDDFALQHTVQDKLDFMLKVIDGKAAELPDNMITLIGATPGAVTGLERVNRMRSYIGAMVNRLEHSVSNDMNQIANQQAAESLIRDADFAQESTAYSRNAILTQSATAMLAQANMRQQSVLGLIR